MVLIYKNKDILILIKKINIKQKSLKYKIKKFDKYKIE